jgi:hypothetical protein
MSEKQKRILLISFLLLACILAVVIGLRFIPFNKILKISGTKEAEFVNKVQINAKVPNSLYFDFEVDPNSGIQGTCTRGLPIPEIIPQRPSVKTASVSPLKEKQARSGWKTLGPWR